LLLVRGDKVRLQKTLNGDTILAEKVFEWDHHKTYQLKLQANNNKITAWVNDNLLFDLVDEDRPLTTGGVAYIVDQGHISSQSMTVKPIPKLNQRM
jgi:hypothetical protein